MQLANVTNTHTQKEPVPSECYRVRFTTVTNKLSNKAARTSRAYGPHINQETRTMKTASRHTSWPSLGTRDSKECSAHSSLGYTRAFAFAHSLPGRRRPLLSVSCEIYKCAIYARIGVQAALLRAPATNSTRHD